MNQERARFSWRDTQWVGWAYERARAKGDPIGDLEIRSLLDLGALTIERSRAARAEFDAWFDNRGGAPVGHQEGEKQ